MLDIAADILRPVYDRFIRHRLPRTLGVYNGVITRRFYLLDLQGTDRESEYKQELVDCTRETITRGDTVLEIGSGYGVNTVWAAREVGDSGTVVGYEAGSQQIEVLREALELNSNVIKEDLTDRVEIEHAVVGTDIEIYGPMAGASRVSPSELPECDVVVMDCEGAETDILRECEVEPRGFVVETHPEFGSSTEESVSILESMGYDVRKVVKDPKPGGTKHILVAEKS